MSVTVTLEDEIDISRGDLLVHARNVPRTQSSFEGMVVWMAEQPMHPDRPYLVKHTTRTTRASVQKIEYRVDVNTLSRLPPAPLGLNEIGRVALQTTRAALPRPVRAEPVHWQLHRHRPRHQQHGRGRHDHRPGARERASTGRAPTAAPRSANIRHEVGPRAVGRPRAPARPARPHRLAHRAFGLGEVRHRAGGGVAPPHGPPARLCPRRRQPPLRSES